MRRVYIRHADKEYVNGDSNSYKHDPGITKEGIENTKEVGEYLVKQWGTPERIIVSPYRRTRETASFLRGNLDVEVPVHVDNDVAEYLGNHRHEELDVTESTSLYNPPHPENFYALKERVKKHHRRITRYTRKKKDGVIWIVTHGLIIKQVANLIGIKMAKEFPTLTCLSILESIDNQRGEVVISHNNIRKSRDNISGIDSFSRSGDGRSSDTLFGKSRSFG